MLFPLFGGVSSMRSDCVQFRTERKSSEVLREMNFTSIELLSSWYLSPIRREEVRLGTKCIFSLCCCLFIHKLITLKTLLSSLINCHLQAPSSWVVSSKTEIWNELSHRRLQIQSPKLAFRCYENALNFLHSAIQFSFLSVFLLKWNSM